MSTVSVKVPDRLKQDAKETAEQLGYTGLSEFIRDAMRDKIEEQLRLRPAIVADIQERLREIEEGEADPVPHEDVKEKVG